MQLGSHMAWREELGKTLFYYDAQTVKLPWHAGYSCARDGSLKGAEVTLL